MTQEEKTAAARMIEAGRSMLGVEESHPEYARLLREYHKADEAFFRLICKNQKIDA